jgi:DMSO/TMAO reductase YedYZ heme-binding membrane subunit
MNTNVILLAINFILGVLIVVPTFAFNFRGEDSSSLVGSLFLLLTLLPKNLLRFEQFAQRIWLRSLARIRRELGIASGVWFIFHAVLSVRKYFNLEDNLLTQLTYREILPGFLALLVFIILLATSNPQSQKLLKHNWKRLHSSIWVVLPLILIHIILVTLHYRGEVLMPPVVDYALLMGFSVVEFLGLRFRMPAKSWHHSVLIGIGCIIALPIVLFAAKTPSKDYFNCPSVPAFAGFHRDCDSKRYTTHYIFLKVQPNKVLQTF